MKRRAGYFKSGNNSIIKDCASANICKQIQWNDEEGQKPRKNEKLGEKKNYMNESSQKPKRKDNDACNITSYAFHTNESFVKPRKTLSRLLCVKSLKHGMSIWALETKEQFYETCFFFYFVVVIVLVAVVFVVVVLSFVCNNAWKAHMS